MTAEIYKDIVGYEGIYKISNYGNVLSLARTVQKSNGTTRKLKQRILKNRVIKKNGRVINIQVKLSSQDQEIKNYKQSIARLELIAFVGEIDGMVASFKDGNAGNIKLENLEWSSFKKIANEKKNGGYSKHWAIS